MASCRTGLVLSRHRPHLVREAQGIADQVRLRKGCDTFTPWGPATYHRPQSPTVAASMCRSSERRRGDNIPRACSWPRCHIRCRRANSG